MNFDSLEALADHFAGVERRIVHGVLHELPQTGLSVQTLVRSFFGTYGPGWAVLAPSTQAERVRMGYTPDDPLYRSGELQELVTYRIEGEGLFVGIEDGELADGTSAPLVMAALENGTEDGHIPPRPVFGQAVAQMDRIAYAFAHGLVTRIRL